MVQYNSNTLPGHLHQPINQSYTLIHPNLTLNPNLPTQVDWCAVEMVSLPIIDLIIMLQNGEPNTTIKLIINKNNELSKEGL
jgi:hypothetical protein